MEFTKIFLVVLTRTFLCSAAVIPSGGSGEVSVELSSDSETTEAPNSSTETPGLDTTTLQTEIPSAITDFAAFMKAHLNISTIQLEDSEFPSSVITAAKNGARVRVTQENGISSCQPVRVRDSEGGLYSICRCSEITIQNKSELQRSSNKDVLVPPRLLTLGDETTSTETVEQSSEIPNDSTDAVTTEASSNLPESSLPSETLSTEWLSQETTAVTEGPVISEETTVQTEGVPVSEEPTTSVQLETTETSTFSEARTPQETTMIVTNEDSTAESNVATEQTTETSSEARTDSATAVADAMTTVATGSTTVEQYVPGSNQGLASVAEILSKDIVADDPVIIFRDETSTVVTETETTTLPYEDKWPFNRPLSKRKRQAPNDAAADDWIALPILYIYPDVCGEDEPCCSHREQRIRPVETGTSTISNSEETVSSTPKPIVTGENSVVPVITHPPGVNAQLTGAANRWQNDSDNFVKNLAEGYNCALIVGLAFLTTKLF